MPPWTGSPAWFLRACEHNKAAPREARPTGAELARATGDAIRDRLAEAGSRLVSQRGADVLILGCAAMAGHRRALQELLGRPVVEPTQQAVATALGSLLLAAA